MELAENSFVERRAGLVLFASLAGMGLHLARQTVLFQALGTLQLRGAVFQRGFTALDCEGARAIWSQAPLHVFVGLDVGSEGDLVKLFKVTGLKDVVFEVRKQDFFIAVVFRTVQRHFLFFKLNIDVFP